MSSDSSHAYWRANLSLVGFCLAIWAIVSYGFGILLRPVLDNISLGGYKLGFWFAQQGSMYVFLILIAFYAIRMKAIDRKFDVHED
jgi:putative solute:sodium symporter small subunit